MPSYKLNYFDIRGLAEPIRLCFVIAGVPFEDNRVQQDDWPALKPKMPNGHMPVLEVDGEMLPEAKAITGYLGREFSLKGANNWESALVDVVTEMIGDLMKPMSETIMFEKDEAKKVENAKKYYAETAPPMLERLEARLESNKGGDGFFVGDKISLSDIAFYTSMDYFLKAKELASLDKYPKLKDLRDRFAADKNVAPYLEKRKVTDM